MKVICAGFPKTGTKSMAAALKELGYNVYDYLENYQYLGDDWNRICTEGGTTEDFRRMFENVDVVADVPACYFWDEIHKAFPEAKIILTCRDNEDTWAESFRNQIAESSSPYVTFRCALSPTFLSKNRYGKRLGMVVFGSAIKESLFKPGELNMLLVKMVYRRHNAHVLQNAPKDKLLVYNVKEGWEPLCNFLGVEVPSTPFPHRNVRGNILEEWFKKEPLMKRGQLEVKVSLSLLGAFFFYCTYKLYKSPPSNWYEYIHNSVSVLWEMIRPTFMRQ